MIISLRMLKEKDIVGMSEWMHDPDIMHHFRFSKEPLSRESMLYFIYHSITSDNRHYAIVNGVDEYLGTISLKKINVIPKTAEYAIVLRKSCQGMGIAQEATRLILEKAFSELSLEVVYLNVLNNNTQAIRFYEKFGFGIDDDLSFVREDNSNEFAYYRICKRDYYQRAWRLLSFDEKGDDRGHLVIAEGRKSIPFEIKRIFYMYGTQGDAIRGKHANRRSEFVFIVVKGSVSVDIDTGSEQTKVVLAKPNSGLYLPHMIWKQMYDFSQDSILLVLSSEHYDANEYIYDHDQYCKEVSEDL